MIQKISLLCGPELKADTSTPGWARLAENRWWELETDLFLTSFLREGDTVIDVGAYEGITALLAAAIVGKTGAVYAFEPDAELHSIVERNRDINNLTNIICENIGVSRTSGLLSMKRDENARYATAYGDASDATADVECISLDDYCRSRSIDTATLIKIDVDGPELQCLLGAIELLSKPTPPALVVELSAEHERVGDTASDILEFVTSLGYRCFATRMKFPFAHEVRTMSDFSKLPVDFSKREVANLFCVKPEVHFERLMQGFWCFGTSLPSYHRHYLSASPFPSASDFWAQYNAEIEAFFGQNLSRHFQLRQK